MKFECLPEDMKNFIRPMSKKDQKKDRKTADAADTDKPDKKDDA